jgi:hypothetical protein
MALSEKFLKFLDMLDEEDAKTPSVTTGKTQSKMNVARASVDDASSNIEPVLDKNGNWQDQGIHEDSGLQGYANDVGDFGNALVRNLPGGSYIDEAVGLVGGDQAKQDYLDAEKARDVRSPYLTGAGTAIGQILPSVASVGAKGLSLLQQIALGGIQGFGQQNDATGYDKEGFVDGGGRLQNAATGAALAGAVGAIPKVGGAIQRSGGVVSALEDVAGTEMPSIHDGPIKFKAPEKIIIPGTKETGYLDLSQLRSAPEPTLPAWADKGPVKSSKWKAGVAEPVTPDMIVEDPVNKSHIYPPLKESSNVPEFDATQSLVPEVEGLIPANDPFDPNRMVDLKDFPEQMSMEQLDQLLPKIGNKPSGKVASPSLPDETGAFQSRPEVTETGTTPETKTSRDPYVDPFENSQTASVSQTGTNQGAYKQNGEFPLIGKFGSEADTPQAKSFADWVKTMNEPLDYTPVTGEDPRVAQMSPEQLDKTYPKISADEEVSTPTNPGFNRKTVAEANTSVEPAENTVVEPSEDTVVKRTRPPRQRKPKATPAIDTGMSVEQPDALAKLRGEVAQDWGTKPRPEGLGYDGLPLDQPAPKSFEELLAEMPPEYQKMIMDRMQPAPPDVPKTSVVPPERMGGNRKPMGKNKAPKKPSKKEAAHSPFKDKDKELYKPRSEWEEKYKKRGPWD